MSKHDAARAVLLRGGHRNAAIAAAEVVDDIVLGDVGHLQHGLHDRLRRRHIDHVGTARRRGGLRERRRGAGQSGHNHRQGEGKKTITHSK